MKNRFVWQDWRIHWTTWRQWLLAVSVIPCLMACAGAPLPPPPAPQPLKIEIHAAADINPDARERPSPVTIRVYLLKSTAAFTSADFLSLFSKEQAVLGADLLQKEEVQLKPGEKRQINMSVPKDAKHIAVMSAFRDIGRAQWRDVKPLSANPGWSVPLGGRKVQLIQSP